MAAIITMMSPKKISANLLMMIIGNISIITLIIMIMIITIMNGTY